MTEHSMSIYHAFLSEGVDLKTFDFGRYIDFANDYPSNQELKERGSFDFSKVDWEHLAPSGVNYNTLILGNSGVGKTETTTLLAEVLNIPLWDTDAYFPKDKAQFAIENNYNLLLLAPQKQDIYTHLFDDWLAYINDGETRRIRYEKLADEVFTEKIGEFAGTASDIKKAASYASGCVYNALADFYDKEEDRQTPALKQFVKDAGGLVITPKEEASKAEVAAICLGAMVYFKQREQ